MMVESLSATIPIREAAMAESTGFIKERIS
jgi:hypothetical protein